MPGPKRWGEPQNDLWPSYEENEYDRLKDDYEYQSKTVRDKDPKKNYPSPQQRPDLQQNYIKINSSGLATFNTFLGVSPSTEMWSHHPSMDFDRVYFRNVSAKIEGRVPHLYVDNIGLATIGIGCMVDKEGDKPPTHGLHDEALKLPFFFSQNHKDPDIPLRPASQKDIEHEYEVVKKLDGHILAVKQAASTNLVIKQESTPIRQLIC
jgi:hypothetical protein